MDQTIIETLTKYVEYPYRTISKLTKMAEDARTAKVFDPVLVRQEVRNLIPNLESDDENQIMGYIAVIALNRVQHLVVQNHILDADDYDILKHECEAATYLAMQTYDYGKGIFSYTQAAMKNRIMWYYNSLQHCPIKSAHDFKDLGRIAEYEAKHGHVNVKRMANELGLKLCRAKRLYQIRRLNTSHDDEIAIETYSKNMTLDDIMEESIRQEEESAFTQNLVAAALVAYEPALAYAIMLFTKVKSINQMKPKVLQARLFFKYLEESNHGDCKEFVERVTRGLCVADFNGLSQFIHSPEESRVAQYAFFRAKNDMKAIEDGIASEEECLGNKYNLNYQINMVFPTTKAPRSKQAIAKAKQFKKELTIRGLDKIAESLGV
jgi:hypothetical protein